MFFFIAHLKEEKSSIPWMFYFVGHLFIEREWRQETDTEKKLQGSAILTLVTNLVMGLWIFFRSWIPKVSATVNGILAATWAAGYGLLIDAMKSTITTPCSVAYWGDNRGILVCSLYKALLAAGAVGLTISMVALDVIAARRLRNSRKTRTGMKELLLGKQKETVYEPVWSTRDDFTVNLEPTENEKYEGLRRNSDP
ncbi:unnamed protein product [Clonostachys rosea]|uniref:MARVEL domain-containing protein n=1 Tax=Bionectria ochroleuca TaxID=29856 RepID=A0ABY6U4Q6_BIOOC|nr:unnamed protein product [Clonostachys rosea]